MSKRKKGKTMVSLKKTEIPETPQYQEINSDTEVEFISEGIGFEDVVEFENLNKGEEEMNRKIRDKRNHNEEIMNSREVKDKNISDKIAQKGEEKMENNYAAMNNNDIKEEKYITISEDKLKQLIEEEAKKEINKKEDELPKPQVEIIDEVDTEEDLNEDEKNKEEEEVIINKIDNKTKAKTLIKGIAVFAGSICLGYFVGKMAKGTVEEIQKEAIESASIGIKEFM